MRNDVTRQFNVAQTWPIILVPNTHPLPKIGEPWPTQSDGSYQTERMSNKPGFNAPDVVDAILDPAY